MSVPANIITGFLMYANSHYYYSLDCCNPEGSHTGVYITTIPTVVYSCDDPAKKPIDVGGPIIEEMIAGEGANYELAGSSLKADSLIQAAKAAPGLTLTSLGKIAFREVPDMLSGKAYGLYGIDSHHRTYVFAVYEGVATGGEKVVQPVAKVGNAELLFVVPIDWDGKTVRVRILAHN